ncbi:unnamed protein product [Ectocarpus sp. 6 AP-2014]
MADAEAAPTKHFVHTQASHFTTIFFFYAYGNTPPTDLLQHVPHDAERADVLSLGCSDLRDLLYSVLLHGRRGVSCGPVPRQLSFTLNDWEPAIHARNLMLLQMILDSRGLLNAEADGVDDVVRGMDTVAVDAGSGDRSIPEAAGKSVGKKKAAKKKTSDKTPTKPSLHGAAFAQRIGVIFSAMYNMFVDANTLKMVHEVAGRLASSAASPAEWSSTELGRIVRFADDRSQDRVREILTNYTDHGLQEPGVFTRIRRERTAFLTKYMPKSMGNIISRAMGLSSFCQGESIEANAKMRRQYLREGILDPFPLLLEEGAPAVRRGPFRKVNPLLLVTERKGAASSLHYGAFPLDAFHTDVSWWKVRPESLQDEFGKLAPRVTKHRDAGSHSGPGGPKVANGVRQDAWFGTALEELAQMCGAFLAATSTSVSSAAPALGIILQVGDSLNFCDALLTASPSRGAVEDCTTSAEFAPISFQQGSVQPLHLRADVFSCQPEFDVISTNNLVEHLGMVNVLVASAPLLKALPHAVLLTSLMATLVNLHQYKDLADFQAKLLCMSSQAAGILLGVAPVSSLSSVVGHADTMTLVAGSLGTMFSRQKGASESAPSQFRLVWKRPSAALGESVAAEASMDISPADLVSLTLPVYKNMSPMAGPFGMTREMIISMATTANHYTSVSFIRLLVGASRRLRLSATHYRAVLHALMNNSGMMLASNLSQEQMALFHALDLARMRPCDLGSGPIPLDTRRVVLLVPKSGLSLLRHFQLPGVYLSVTGATTMQPFDNHFTCAHMAYVRVHRGGGLGGEGGGGDGWRSLNKHLSVRDAREDDPEAELMVSALLPTIALVLAVPSVTELQLRPRESIEVINAPKDIKKRLGGDHKVFYKAGISDADRVAVLTPGEAGKSVMAAESPPPLACPQIGVACIPDQATSAYSAQLVRKSTSEAAALHRALHGDSAIDQSVELINQAGRGSDVLLAYKVTLVMANDHARARLAAAEGAPAVELSRDPCSIRVKLEEGLRHTARLPFPVAKRSAMKIKFSKSKGYLCVTAPLLKGPLQAPFSLTVYSNTEGAGHKAIPSTAFWPPCAPLSSLPRLDFKAEWIHRKVMGEFSLTHAEVLMRDEATTQKKGGVDPALLGLKESFMAIASMACTYHQDELPVWTHPWVCISDNHRFDQPAIWLWVNEILLDSSNEALILDCCVMPVARMDDPVSAQLRETIELQDGPSFVASKAYPGELALWTALLPVAVERARQTYAHTADCTYASRSDAPLALCDCGRGKDLHSECMHSIELANAMGARVPVHPSVYRAAFSPLYAPPGTSSFVTVAKMAAASVAGSPKCAKCGIGGKSLQCTRCRKVSYCSKECQRQHWKIHKAACG